VTELLDNGTDIDASIDSHQGTALQKATEYRYLDLIRMLLQRGASPDHHNQLGCDVYIYCNLLGRESNQETSAKEIYDVLSEYIVPNLEINDFWSSTVLQMAAERVNGQDIKALVALGADLDTTNSLGRPALYNAVRYGNASAYLALLELGARWDMPECRAENLMFVALARRAREEYEYCFNTPDFEAIVRHLLRHRNVHLGVLVTIPAGLYTRLLYPRSLFGRRATFKQLARAYNPEMEAWFLRLVQEECGTPDASEDERRLLASRLEPCAVRGCGLCEERVRFEDDVLNGDSDRFVSDDDDDRDDDDEDDQSSSSGEESEAAEEEQFWDAEEGMQSV
jgi:ankyrin repeat protein